MDSGTIALEVAQIALALVAGWCFAVVWHYWLGLVLVISAIVFVVASIGGYLYKVTRSRYPTSRQR